MTAVGILGVLCAGAAGAVLRHLVHIGIDARGLPPRRANLLVNVTGSGLLGVLVGLAATGAISTTILAIVGTGFCGAFTTFSAFTVDTVQVARTDRRAARRATVVMVGLCASAAAVGAVLAGVR